jgi:hypothetical protein
VGVVAVYELDEASPDEDGLVGAGERVDGGLAAEGAAFPFRAATPDAGVLGLGEGGGEAVEADGAGDAERAGLGCDAASRRAVGWVPEVWVLAGACGAVAPLLDVDRGLLVGAVTVETDGEQVEAGPGHRFQPNQPATPSAT